MHFACVGVVIPDLVSGRGNSDMSKFPNTVTQNPYISPSVKTCLLFTWKVTILITPWDFSKSRTKSWIQNKQRGRKKTNQQQMQESFSSSCIVEQQCLLSLSFCSWKCLRDPCHFDICIDMLWQLKKALPLEVSLAVTSL